MLFEEQQIDFYAKVENQSAVINEVQSTRVDVIDGKVVAVVRVGPSNLPHVFEMNAEGALELSGKLEAAAQKIDPPQPQSTEIVE